MKIVILDAYTANPGDLSWDGLRALGELTIYDRTAACDVDARMAGADIVLTNKTPITAANIEAAKSLRYIGVLATGYNIVDVAAARARHTCYQYPRVLHRLGGAAGVCAFA